MNTEQALGIVRLAKGAFPATTMDEFTPEAWSLALEDDRFEDAREAIKQLMRTQTFIHVSDIVQRIKRLRHDRILAYGAINPPADLDPDDPGAYRTWHVRTYKAIADGELVNDNPQVSALGSGPWSEEQDRAVHAAQWKRVREEVDARQPTAKDGA